MPQHILILEDERPSADRIKRQLRTIDPTLQLSGPLETVQEATAWLNQNQPDIILADIRLADGLSFEALQHAPAHAAIIFTTAYDEYALRAFKYNSIDYLLKPIEADELAAALRKARQQTLRDNTLALQALLNSLPPQPGRYRQRFLVPCFDGYRTVAVADISHFTSENKVTTLCQMDGKTERIAFSLDDLERELDPDRFFRATRQHIISADAQFRITQHFNGKLRLTLKAAPTAEVLISKERVPKFKAWLDR